jgi:NAD(P)-dependent dehydrogenase (short-subunit alcohol dehydrogenase family)
MRRVRIGSSPRTRIKARGKWTVARITTQFGSGSTAAEVIQGIDLSGKRAIVTGGASGIGIETARAIASAGAAVTLAVRRPEAAAAVAADICASSGNSAVEIKPLDLADLASVRRFCADWDGPLHILVNNAGIMALPELQRTQQGLELQFATNFLGHFALATGLHRALAAASGARIASVSSSANMMAPVFFDDPHFNFIPYDPRLAYAQSKTACALFAVEVTRRWAKDGIFSNALNPGAILTNLQKHVGGKLVTPPEKQKNPEQGAATSVLLVTSPQLEGVGGRYFEDCNEASVVSKRPENFGGGVAPYAIDPANAQRLWDLATVLLA